MPTKIQWCGEVWNVVTGCTKVSAGCASCYAERDFHRPYPGRDFNDVRFHRDRLNLPLRWRKPRKVFTPSIGDLFHLKLPDEVIEEVWQVMVDADRHTFQVLTKRPGRMQEFVNRRYGLWGEPENIWLGVSVEDQENDWRIPILLQTPAAVRFVSCEPLLGPIQFGDGSFDWLAGWYTDYETGRDGEPEPVQAHMPNIDWVIVGGESGPNARPMHPDWVRSIRDQCRVTDVAFFFKQWGEWIPWIPMGGNPRNLPVEHVMQNGSEYYPGNYSSSLQSMIRVGKKAASRMLDGRTWDEFPE